MKKNKPPHPQTCNMNIRTNYFLSFLTRPSLRLCNERRGCGGEKNKGSALAYMLVIMAVVSIILVSSLQYISSQIKFGFYRENKEKSLQIAEAGVYFYRWYLAHQVSGRTAQQIENFWNNEDPYGVDEPYEAEFFDPEGGAIGKYKIEVDPPETGSTIIYVTSTGWTYKNPDVKRTVKVRFRRPSWSEHAVLANDFIRFGGGTSVYGKIHSNFGIRFDGVAHNIISSAVYQWDDPDHSGGNEFGVHTHVTPTDPLPPSAIPQRADVFEAGRQFPLPAIDFNGVLSDLNYMKDQANNGHGDYYNETGGGRRIILKTDGTYDICTVNSYYSSSKRISNYKRNSGGGTCSSCSGNCLTNHTIPNNGIIFVENNVWIEGTINNKKVTIVAANLKGGTPADVYMGLNNLLYTNFDGKDIIGLVGQNNISVVYDSQNYLTIDAALLAQSGRVGRDYYSGNYKNTITINGSIATNKRYGFAWVCGGGTHCSGYQTRNLNFDNNLLYYPPPYFPTGTEYSLDLWNEL